jgi:hypothetical protein
MEDPVREKLLNLRVDPMLIKSSVDIEVDRLIMPHTDIELPVRASERQLSWLPMWQ